MTTTITAPINADIRTSQSPVLEDSRNCFEYLRTAQPQTPAARPRVVHGSSQLEFVESRARFEVPNLWLDPGAEREIYYIAQPDRHVVSISFGRGQLLRLWTQTTGAAGTLLPRRFDKTEFIATRLNELLTDLQYIEDEDEAECKIQEEIEYLVRESAGSMYDLLAVRMLDESTSSDSIGQSIIRALGYVRDSASDQMRLEFLSRALKHSQTGIRLAAVDALGIIGGVNPRKILTSHITAEPVPTIQKLIDSILRI